VDASIGTGQPRRPDEAAPRAPARRWIAPLAVLLVIVVVVGGGFVVFAALAEPAGPPVGVAGVVSVQPLSGWGVAGQGSLAGRDYTRLSRGSGTLDVVSWGPVSDAGALATDYRSVLQSQLSHLQVSDALTPVVLEDGASGVRFRYVGVVADTGATVEGVVTCVVTPGGRGVVFDGWAPQGMLSFVDGDIETMVDRAVIG
jgi:hypothetical protein